MEFINKVAKFCKVGFCTFIVFIVSCTPTSQSHIPSQEPAMAGDLALDMPYVIEEEVIGDQIYLSIPDIEDLNFNTEEYSRIYENSFQSAIQNPQSTFSIDVDNASYSNIRRYLEQGETVPKGAVRIEEMINYFSYDYSAPKDEHPFAFVTEVGPCPWNKENKLVHIGIKGKSMEHEEQKPSNLVFLIDVSGSMTDRNKLPLLRKSLIILLDELNKDDRVAIVAYAGSAGLVLPSTSVKERGRILEAIDQLEAGGSTAGGQGIELAYAVAEKNIKKQGNNRVILATDGDFNIGTSSTSELVRLIEDKRKKDIYLTICGFGMGNYKDSRMEEISNAGNGNYFYIDDMREAKKVFVDELKSNIYTIAKDVKIQIEFNPKKVKEYRLIGYENRLLNDKDFENDKKDAGELGAGHTVTALYEINPNKGEGISRDHLKYQESKLSENANSEELMMLKFRYKPIQSSESIPLEHAVLDKDSDYSSDNFRFSAAVSGFGLLLIDSEYKGDLNYDKVLELAKGASGEDENGYRKEFIQLVKTAELIEKSKM